MLNCSLLAKVVLIGEWVNANGCRLICRSVLSSYCCEDGAKFRNLLNGRGKEGRESQEPQVSPCPIIVDHHMISPTSSAAVERSTTMSYYRSYDVT